MSAIVLPAVCRRSFAVQNKHIYYPDGRALIARDVLGSEQAASSAFMRAKRCFDAGDFESAGAICESLVQRQCSSVEVLLLLGACASKLSQTSYAITALRSALNIDPNLPDAQYSLGCLLRATADVEGAQRCLSAAVLLSPDFVVAWIELGAALAASGDAVGALRCYREATQLNPRNLRVAVAYAHALHDCGKTDQALKAYLVAASLLQALPAEPAASFSARPVEANVVPAVSSGRAAASRAVAETTTLAAAEKASIFDRLGVLYAERGMHPDATAAFRQALDLDARCHAAPVTRAARGAGLGPSPSPTSRRASHAVSRSSLAPSCRAGTPTSGTVSGPLSRRWRISPELSNAFESLCV